MLVTYNNHSTLFTVCDLWHDGQYLQRYPAQLYVTEVKLFRKIYNLFSDVSLFPLLEVVLARRVRSVALRQIEP